MEADAPSATARLIATSTLYTANDPRAGRLVPPRAAELSARLLGPRSRAARWMGRGLRRRIARPFVAALERLTIPGIQLHYALRKLYLEEAARAALGDGIRQIVVLGAGYDTLALRLHAEWPAALFVETDHPATQRRKTGALGGRLDPRPQPSATNLHFLPVDLTRGRLAGALRGVEGFRPEAGTLFIAEGLLMYLSQAEVGDLFRAVRGSAGARGRFAFTFMEPQRDGRVNFRTRSRAVDAWLGWRREVFRWGISREELPAYLSARGFAVRKIATDETFRRRYLEPANLAHLPLAAGEYVCVAGVGGEGSQ